jgi:hypothetical protein
MTTDAHPAFPSAPVSGGSSSARGSNYLDYQDLAKLLSQSTPLTGVKQKLIPALERLANHQNHEHAEQVLCQADEKIEEKSDSDITRLSIPYLYIL